MCRAVVDEIVEAAARLLAERLKGAAPTTFSVIVDVRSNAGIAKNDVIHKVADQVQRVDSRHAVQLFKPETIVLVQVRRPPACNPPCFSCTAFDPPCFSCTAL